MLKLKATPAPSPGVRAQRASTVLTGDRTQSGPGAVFTQPTTGTNPNVCQTHNRAVPGVGVGGAVMQWNIGINKNLLPTRTNVTHVTLNGKAQTQGCKAWDSSDRKFWNKRLHGPEVRRVGQGLHRQHRVLGLFRMQSGQLVGIFTVTRVLGPLTAWVGFTLIQRNTMGPW